MLRARRLGLMRLDSSHLFSCFLTEEIVVFCFVVLLLLRLLILISRSWEQLACKLLGMSSFAILTPLAVTLTCFARRATRSSRGFVFLQRRVSSSSEVIQNTA